MTVEEGLPLKAYKSLVEREGGWVSYGSVWSSRGKVDEKRRRWWRVASLGRRRKPRKLCDETAAGFSGIARLRALETRLDNRG